MSEVELLREMVQQLASRDWYWQQELGMDLGDDADYDGHPLTVPDDYRDERIAWAESQARKGEPA